MRPPSSCTAPDGPTPGGCALAARRILRDRAAQTGAGVRGGDRRRHAGVAVPAEHRGLRGGVAGADRRAGRLRTGPVPDPRPDPGGPRGGAVRPAGLDRSPRRGKVPVALLGSAGDGAGGARPGGRAAAVAGGGRRGLGRGAAPDRRRAGAQDRVCGRGGAGPASGPGAVSRGRRDRDPAPLRAAHAPDGAAPAGLLECRGPAGPSAGAGSGGAEDRALAKVVEGLRAGKTPRQMAMDIFGEAEVVAEWSSDSWMRSQLRRWIPRARDLADGGWRELVPRYVAEE